MGQEIMWVSIVSYRYELSALLRKSKLTKEEFSDILGRYIVEELECKKENVYSRLDWYFSKKSKK